MRTARAKVERAIFTFSVAAGESTRIYGDHDGSIRWYIL
jgi:hypothetical protein